LKSSERAGNTYAAKAASCEDAQAARPCIAARNFASFAQDIFAKGSYGNNICEQIVWHRRPACESGLFKGGTPVPLWSICTGYLGTSPKRLQLKHTVSGGIFSRPFYYQRAQERDRRVLGRTV